MMIDTSNAVFMREPLRASDGQYHRQERPGTFDTRSVLV